MKSFSASINTKRENAQYSDPTSTFSRFFYIEIVLMTYSHKYFAIAFKCFWGDFNEKTIIIKNIIARQTKNLLSFHCDLNIFVWKMKTITNKLRGLFSLSHVQGYLKLRKHPSVELLRHDCLTLRVKANAIMK